MNDSADSNEGSSRRTLLGLGALGLIGLGLGFLAMGRGTSKSPTASALSVDASAFDDGDSPVPVTLADPMRGPRDAFVTVVELANFQCPHSAKALGVLAELETKYGKEKLRLVWKTLVLPTHDKARAAAIAGAAVHSLAGNEAFWKFHDTAFRNQAFLGSESYLSWAADTGVQKVVLQAAMTEAQYGQKVDADDALAKKLGANRTPTFFVNGRSIEATAPLERWVTLVEAELEKAQKKLASGVPRDRVYVELSKENWKSAH